MIGFILGAAAVALLTGALVAFWDSIRNWLNSTAANFVEKHLGYNARQKMHKAVSTATRIVDKVRNTSVIYTKKNRLDTYYDKTTIVAEQSVYKINQEVLDNIQEKGQITETFEYNF